MESGRFLCLLLLACFACLLPATEGYNFYVGGRDGWVLKPSESYSHWAERNRFQVNDTLYFKYNKGSDSVLVVNKDSFFSCNTSNPMQKLDEGNSEFKFDRSGPFYFISGKEGNCANGQKLIIVVLAVRHRQTPPAQPSLASPPPQGSAPAPAGAPSSQGSAPTPSSSPSHAPSTTPTTSPVPAPAGSTTTPSSSPPSPGAISPTPSGDVPSGNVTSPPPGSTQNSTAPPGNGAYGVTASSVLVSSVLVLVSLALMSSSY